ncbi:MAG: cytochrome b [Pseudomonadota bacterium]
MDETLAISEPQKATRLTNTRTGYGLVARGLHWVMAIAILAMFGLGVWMRTLGYYHPWYNLAPDIHRGIGILLLLLVVLRLVWRFFNVAPDPAPGSRAERLIAAAVHAALYILLIAMMIAGYLISTADGRPLDVFGLVSVPAVIESKGAERIAGLAHEYLAYALIALAALHALAALKHHFIDRDGTLARMWRGPADDRC